jgi:hypothetical protein
MAEKMQLIWVGRQALFPKIRSRLPAANWHDGRAGDNFRKSEAK